MEWSGGRRPERNVPGVRRRTLRASCVASERSRREPAEPSTRNDYPLTGARRRSERGEFAPSSRPGIVSKRFDGANSQRFRWRNLSRGVGRGTFQRSRASLLVPRRESACGGRVFL